MRSFSTQSPKKRRMTVEILEHRTLLSADGVLQQNEVAADLQQDSDAVQPPVIEAATTTPGVVHNDVVEQPGDANGDGLVNQLDIFQVLQAGKYMSGDVASWSEGDWNDDNLFNQLDIVVALQSGRYVDPGLTVAAARFLQKVTVCHKPGTPAEKTMQVPDSAVAGHLVHGDVIGSCLTGVDTFPSGGSITLLPPIVPNPEIVPLSSAGLPDAIIERQQQSGDVIETEMVSLQLTGTSIDGIPVSVKVGSSFGLPASTGQIINVVRDADGGFGSGDSFFDVFFEVEVGGNVARNDEAVRLEASAPITSLPPNDPDDPDNTECIEYAEDVLGQTGLPITDPIHIPFANDPESVCKRVGGN